MRKTTEVKTHFTTLYQRYIQSIWFIIVFFFVVCHCWCWPWCPGWYSVSLVSPYKITSPAPLTIPHSLEATRYAQLTLKERELYPPSFRGEYLHKLFRILLHGKFVSSYPFIYLSNHFFTSIWTRGNWFCTLGYNLILLYLFCCSNGSSFGYREFFWFSPVSLWQPPTCPVTVTVSWVVPCFVSFSASFLPGPTRCSSLQVYFLPQPQNPPFLLGALVRFIGKYQVDSILSLSYREGNCCLEKLNNLSKVVAWLFYSSVLISLEGTIWFRLLVTCKAGTQAGCG